MYLKCQGVLISAKPILRDKVIGGSESNGAQAMARSIALSTVLVRFFFILNKLFAWIAPFTSN